MFKSVEELHLAKFNSSNSCQFLDDYENYLDKLILEGESKAPSKTFAPSSIRCQRISWFRLRGVEPEQEVNVDRTLNFTAQVGTACHRVIQENLSKLLGSDWLDAGEYLDSEARPYSYTYTKSGPETLIHIVDPPVRFAPDGIIRYHGKTWLLEIKTSEFGSFDSLTGPKSQHIDQVKCYCTLLNLDGALILYQDRLYGGFKCYEIDVTLEDKQNMWAMFKDVEDKVKSGIAPPKLPVNDPWCSPSRCRYYNKCKEW